MKRKHLTKMLLCLPLTFAIGCAPDDPQRPAKTDTESATATESETAAVDETPAPITRQYSDDAYRDAAMNGKIEVVRSALDSGTKVNAADLRGRTALHWAAFNGHRPIAKLLLDRGAEIDLRDAEGRTALMYASTADNADTVKLLLAADAEVNLIDKKEGFTALMFAAGEGQAAVVTTLLDAGAKTDTKDIDGDDARHFASEQNHQAVIELLDAHTAKQ